MAHWVSACASLAMNRGRHLQVALLAARRNQAEQGVALERARWKPEIFAFGNYSLIKKYQTLIEPDWIAGVGVNCVGR